MVVVVVVVVEVTVAVVVVVDLDDVVTVYVVEVVVVVEVAVVVVVFVVVVVDSVVVVFVVEVVVVFVVEVVVVVDTYLLRVCLTTTASVALRRMVKSAWDLIETMTTTPTSIEMGIESASETPRLASASRNESSKVLRSISASSRLPNTIRNGSTVVVVVVVVTVVKVDVVTGTQLSSDLALHPGKQLPSVSKPPVSSSPTGLPVGPGGNVGPSSSSRSLSSRSSSPKSPGSRRPRPVDERGGRKGTG